MSFFFTPIPSHFQNYCVFLPVLPYFVKIQANSKMNLATTFCQNSLSGNQNSQNQLKNKELSSEISKSSNFNSQNLLLKIEEQIFLQSKKATAALQSQEILNEHTETHKQEKKNEDFSNTGKQSEKSHYKISNAIKIKKSKQVKEQEYQPFEKKRRSDITIRENQNRNIIPNEVNQIFSYIQKSSKSKFVVSRIFKKYPPSNSQFNIKKFYLYQSLLKEKISNYINQSSLSLVTELYEPRCEVYSQQQQRYYNKVCRILIHHFLQQDSIFNILTSRRMHKDKKRNHLQMRRILKQKVIEILRH